MKRKVLTLTMILVLASVLAACSAGASTNAPTPTAVSVSFSKDVLPILQANCARCHGDAVTNYDSLTGSGILMPGDSRNSLIIQVLEAGIMPRGSAKLPAAQIQSIATWIDAGAGNN